MESWNTETLGYNYTKWYGSILLPFMAASIIGFKGDFPFVPFMLEMH